MDDSAIIKALNALAEKHPRWGIYKWALANGIKIDYIKPGCPY
jgi:hypothetical protein